MDAWIGKTGIVFGILVTTIIRWPHVRRNSRVPITVSRKDRQEKVLLALVFFGMMILPLLAVFTPLFGFADYQPLPGQVWCG